MALITLGDFREEVQDAADLENGGPLSIDQVNARINAARKFVYDSIRKARGDMYFEQDAPAITTVTGTQSYDLPDDFLTISAGGVWWIIGTGQNVPIRQYTPNASMTELVNAGWNYIPWSRMSPVRYRVQGPATVGGVSRIRFVPVPLGSYQVLVKYIPQLAPLVDDTDEFDGFGGFEECIKWLAVARCKAKQEADTAFEMEMFKLEYDRVLSTTERDENEPQQVQWVDPEPYGEF